jgi:hypothetical protein
MQNERTGVLFRRMEHALRCAPEQMCVHLRRLHVVDMVEGLPRVRGLLRRLRRRRLATP